MKKYRTVGQLAAAIAAGEVPAEVLSPGGAAASLGITRQAVHDRIRRGTLRAWGSEGVVLVDTREVRREMRRKRGIADTQGELNVTSPTG